MARLTFAVLACLAAAARADDSGVTCGAGTVLEDGACVVDPAILEQLKKDALDFHRKHVVVAVLSHMDNTRIID